MNSIKCSIRTKIFLAIIIVVLVVSLDIFYIMFYQSNYFLVKQARDDYLQLLSSLTSSLKNDITHTEKIMDLLATEINKTYNIPDQINMIKDKYKRFKALFVFDSYGNVLYTSHQSISKYEPKIIYNTLKDENPDFTKIKKSFSLISSHPSLNDVILVFSSYLKIKEDEEINGIVIAGVVERDHLFKEMKTFLDKNPKMSGWVVSGNGVVIWKSEKELIGKKITELQEFFHINTDKISELLSRKEEGALSYEWNSKLSFIFHKSIGYPDWSLILIVDNIPGVESFEKLKKYLIGIIIFNLIFAFILAKLLASGITKPIYQLINEAAKLEKGDYNLNLPIHRSDEIGILANAFKKAIEEIKKRQEIEKNLQFKLLNEQKLAEVGQVVAGLVHNLKNPLNGIKGFAELLKSKNPDNTKMCDMILLAAENMKNIVQSMLDKTKLEQSTKETEINLNHVLSTEINFLQADMFFKHEVEKIIELDETIPSIKGIYSDFSQSFSNIIKNALDAMRNSKTRQLTIKTYISDSFINVQFSDTGEGIPEENLKHIFEPYFTTKSLKDEDKEGRPVGTGLGLYMVRELLKKYQAEFDIKSTVGEGTTFIIKIPYNKKD